MKYKNTTMMVLGAMALGLSTAGSAAAVTDTLDASNPGSGTTYWTPNLTTTGAPYYRWHDEDWEWTHAAIGGSITSASLNVAAYDVDTPGEVDLIYGWDNQAADWAFIGELAGSTDTWDFSNFVLDASWYDEIALGLRVMIDIDSAHSSNVWAVALSKSALSIDGGTIGNPNPGEVPIPAAAFLFAPALLGFMGLRRKAKNTVA